MPPEFVPLANRDATETIRGFVYQMQVTLQQWIDLDDSKQLELECGEDIDEVCEALEDAQPSRRLGQIKLRARSLTLRSPEVLTALVNFFKSKQANPSANLNFRFMTNARAALERRRHPTQQAAALAVWNSTHDNDGGPALEIIRFHIRAAARPVKVKKNGLGPTAIVFHEHA